MFDIAFSELMIIAVVALIVIGPERLPRVARTLGHLFGRMQRYVNEVKSDIQREVELDELRKLKETVEESARSIESSVNQQFDSVNRSFDAARDEVRSLEAMAQERPAASGAPDGSAPAGVPAQPAAADTTKPVQP
jgi:sec-independent protein translocase protein TatB